MMNRVVLDCNIFGLQRFGGISSYWARLVAAVTREKRGNCELILPRVSRFVDMPDHTGVTEYRESLPNGLARYLAAPASGRPATLHSSYYRIPRRRVDRYIVTIYDFTYERYRTGLPQWVHHKQKRTSVEAADVAICISESTREDLLAMVPGVDPLKVHVIPLGVDRTRFFPDRSRGSDSLPPFVLFVGQRHGYKRFDLAIDAVRGVSDLSLGIVGAPLDENEKVKLRSALANRWIEFGPVRDDRLRQIYSDAHSFIFPSDYEGFGLPILEAMACGCPVVAANRSSFPEVAGDAALLSKDQSSDEYGHLIKMHGDSYVRAKLIAKGLERVSMFNWDRTMASTIALYR